MALSTEPTTLQALWHGPALTALQRAALKSFVDHGHRLDLYAYDDLDLPAGVRRLDAAEILPRSTIFHFSNPQTNVPDLGPFSDLFRFKLLKDRGGWYVDVDTFCLTATIPPWRQAWSRERPGTSYVGTGQIAMPAGGELPERLYEACLEASRDYTTREALGPHVITRVVRDLGLPTDVNGGPETFYPVQFTEIFKLWLPEFADEMRDRTREATFLPYYQSFGRYVGFIDQAPPAASLMAELLERHADAEMGAPASAQHVRDLCRSWFERNPWARSEYLMTTDRSIEDDLKGARGPARTMRAIAGTASSSISSAVRTLDDAVMALVSERDALTGTASVPAMFTASFAADAAIVPEKGATLVAGLSTNWFDARPEVSIRQVVADDIPEMDVGRPYVLELDIHGFNKAPFVEVELGHPDLEHGGRLTLIVQASSTRPVHVPIHFGPEGHDHHIGEVHLRDVPRLHVLQVDVPVAAHARVVLHVPASQGKVRFSRLDLLVTPGEQP